jgi:hypothetical protein
MLPIVIVLVVLLVLIWVLKPSKSERFNDTVFESSLEKDMDYIKDNKGYTLNDYVLYDHVVKGTGIESPL